VPNITPPLPDLLYIITTHFNPAKYARRIQLYQEFCSRLASFTSVVIITVECAFENQPFQVTFPNKTPYHIQIRSDSRLWIKECLMNIALEYLKKDNRFLQQCKYVAWVDDDIEFSDPFFLPKLYESLSKYTVVQMFKQAYFLDIDQKLLETFVSFGYYFAEQNLVLGYGQYGHPGYAWATTKNNILEMGEFYDMGILGNGDKHMAAAFIGRIEEGFLKNYPMTEGYENSLKLWQDKIDGTFKRKLGYVDMEIRHHWHGSKDDRQYMYRWKLLLDYKFNPLTDLIMVNGLYKLNAGQKEFEKKIYEFFQGRNEDTQVNIEYTDEKIPSEKNNWKGSQIILSKFDKKLEKNNKVKHKNQTSSPLEEEKNHQKFPSKEEKQDKHEDKMPFKKMPLNEERYDKENYDEKPKHLKKTPLLKENPAPNSTYVMFYPTTESEANNIKKQGFKNVKDEVKLYKNFEEAKSAAINNHYTQPVVAKVLMNTENSEFKWAGPEKNECIVKSESTKLKKSVYLFENKNKNRESSSTSNY
jgi:hypothetical protein